MDKKIIKLKIIFFVLLVFLLNFSFALAKSENVLNVNVKDTILKYKDYIYIYSNADNVTVYYTLDGSEPDNTSNLYTGNGILINDKKIHLKAVGYIDGQKGDVYDFGEFVPENKNGLIVTKNLLSANSFSASETVFSDLEIVSFNVGTKKIDLVLALYDDMELCSVKKYSYTLSNGKNFIPASVAFPDVVKSDNLFARLYIFDSMTNMDPYTDGYEMEEIENKMAGFALPVRKLRSVISVPKAENIEVDALDNEDEWQSAAFYEAKNVTGIDASDVKVKLIYSDTSLYILADVTDSEVYIDEQNIEQSDRLIFYFDAGDENTVYYDENDSYIIITSDGRLSAYGKIKQSDVLFKTASVFGGWTSEISIDLEKIGIDINNKKNPGFDFEFIDYSKYGNYLASHIWRGSSRNIYSTTAFGEMVLK